MRDINESLRSPAFTMAAALTDDDLHAANLRMFPATSISRRAERDDKRAARKVRMAAKRRRGW